MSLYLLTRATIDFNGPAGRILIVSNTFAWSAYALRRLAARPTVAETDEELAQAAAAGSQDDFARLVRRYSDSIYRVVFRLCGSAEDAEDITQETFIKAFKALPQIDLRRPIKPWLYKIAVNSAVSQLRKQRGRVQVELDEAELPPVRDGAEMLPDMIDAQTALAGLPLDYRRVMVLRVIEDMSFADVAEILDIPEATARTRFRRARQMFDKLISD